MILLLSHKSSFISESCGFFLFVVFLYRFRVWMLTDLVCMQRGLNNTYTHISEIPKSKIIADNFTDHHFSYIIELPP